MKRLFFATLAITLGVTLAAIIAGFGGWYWSQRWTEIEAGFRELQLTLQDDGWHHMFVVTIPNTGRRGRTLAPNSQYLITDENALQQQDADLSPMFLPPNSSLRVAVTSDRAINDLPRDSEAFDEQTSKQVLEALEGYHGIALSDSRSRIIVRADWRSWLARTASANERLFDLLPNCNEPTVTAEPPTPCRSADGSISDGVIAE